MTSKIYEAKCQFDNNFPADAVPIFGNFYFDTAGASNLESISEQQFALEVVKFLHQTHLFYQAVLADRVSSTWLSDAFAYPLAIEKQQALQEMVASQATINRCIEVLGGLPLTIIDSETGASFRCTADTWHGYDPDPKSSGNLLWHIKGTAPNQTMSLDSSVISEFFAEFSLNMFAGKKK